MEPKVTLACENQDSYQCPFSAHHMFDKMPSPNSTNKSVVDERSDSTVLALQHLTNFSGVRKRKSGEYLAEKWNPITKKRVWLGTFNTAEEASEVYLRKQREFGSAHHMFDEMPSSNSTNNNVAGAERSKADNGKTKTPFIKEISFRNKSPSFGAELHNMGRLKKQDPFEKRKVSKGFNSNMHDQGKERIIRVESCKKNSCSMSKSSNGCPKAKTGLLGIRKQKNGRYGAEIRDPIRHKQVWLGTFDTIEEASQAYLSKKAEFDMLSHGNKEKKPKNCDQTQPGSLVGASLFVAKDQNLNASNVGRNKEKQPKNCDQTQSGSLVGASLFVANDQTLNAANVGRNKDKKPKNYDQFQPKSSVGASMFVANDQTLNASNVGRNKEKKPKNCDQVQPETSSLSMANDETLLAAKVGRNKINGSPKTTRIVGVHKNKWGKYTSEIINPISKKKIWLGTFSTYEEALEVYQSKKLEFKKLVKPKKKCNKKSHSAAREKQVGKEKLGNAKQGHVNCEGFQPESVAEETFHANQYRKFYIQRSKETALQSNMPIDFCTWEKQIGKEVKQGHVNCEGLQPESAVKFDVQRSKEAELQSKMPVDFSTGEKQGSQEDADLWMGQWVQLPGGKEVNFSLKLGLPIIDNYGSLLGEYSSLDDLRIYDESIY